MNDRLESVKETIKDHPVETALAVGVVTGLGVGLYCNRKYKYTEAEYAARNRPQGPNWFERWMIRRHEIKLARLALPG